MAHTKEKKDACAHDWEPWFTVVERLSLCFFFPGARCRGCGIEMPCAQDPVRALAEFRKEFRISFEDFVREHGHEILEIVAKKGGRGWRIARPEDYRMIPSP